MESSSTANPIVNYDCDEEEKYSGSRGSDGLRNDKEREEEEEEDAGFGAGGRRDEGGGRGRRGVEGRLRKEDRNKRKT